MKKDASVHSVQNCDNPRRFSESREKRSLADVAPDPSGHA